MEIIRKQTSNYSILNNRKILGVVLHITEGTVESTINWFRSVESGVSAHYLVGKDGQVYQFVREEDIAWSNGRINKPSWNLLPKDQNGNTHTISVEHEGYSTDVWPEKQKQASADLIKDICVRNNLPIDREHIVGHYQIDKINRPDCPAKDKKIIDELILLANQPAETTQTQPESTQELPKTTQESVKLGIIERLIELYKELIRLLSGGK
ncbi:N-acetylmuramoyl-L-alanine amidase [Candidatus Roizmanbacteria bacterium]|nr:N-acetylmuramoyl-L-alanine amidase [Candidatus Roizmanbacteria bacterium]